MSLHFENGNSYGPSFDMGPGTAVIDRLASIAATGSTNALTLTEGAWIVTVSGSIASERGTALYLNSQNSPPSKVTIGSHAEITTVDNYAVYAAHASDITNAGRIASGYHGLDIGNVNNGDYRIVNLKGGLIEGDDSALYAHGYGTHTIINNGKIEGLLAIAGDAGVEKVINSGKIVGSVVLGDGGDIFTNFAKSAGAIRSGIVTGSIDLQAGNDVFKGGSAAEAVFDGTGNDTLNFGGGCDRWYGLLSSGDGADKAKGGAGVDAYDAGWSGAEAVTINLDIVAHDDPYLPTHAFAAYALNKFHPADPGDTVEGFENAFGTNGYDTIFGSGARNLLAGGGGEDTLFGLGGRDNLIGGAYGDWLTGGAGKDRLEGGSGADYFIFERLPDSGSTRATRDVIVDFDKASGDIIDLRLLNQELGGIVADFLGTNRVFGGSAGELIANIVGNRTIVMLDADGDRKADLSIELAGQHILSVDNFFL